MIETRNLTKAFKDKIAVDNLNLKINSGELFSLLGTNAAGKTTTIKMLSGLYSPSEGEILIDGKSLKDNKAYIKNMINLSPQETAIAPNLTVIENMEFMAGIYSVKNKKEKIDELTKIFKLDKVLRQKTKTLSGGYQRKLSIALALINEPKILFLDEPTLGLDVIARRELWETIRQLKGKITIILTTHYMEEAEQLSDRVGIMSDGRLVCTGTVEELLQMSGTGKLEDAFVALTTKGAMQ